MTGESGCGKSTLTKLILGYYKPKKGMLNVCGKDYTDCSLEEICEQIAYIPQEPYLYEASIAENIATIMIAHRPSTIAMADTVVNVG